ncbi:MAG: ATP-binding protein, partial [Actinomycetota bacterium]|nr:ATP-binding protein [Actinomycetota bacterium]
MDKRGRRIRMLLASVRMRTTLACALVVACALAVGGLAFVVLLSSSLVANVQDEAQQRAATTAAEISSGSKPRQVAVPGDEDFVLQVIDDRTGALLATSDPKLTKVIRSVHPGEVTTVDHIPIGDGNHSFRIVAEDARTPGGEIRIVVGGSLEHVAESVRAVRRMLLLGVPGVLIVVILTTWLFTGRALRPVEEIRREVADISAQDLDRRVRVPNTTDEVARLALTMNAMLSRLADSQQRQRHFISDASHELRSPITTIRHHAEVALKHPESTDLQEMATTVLAEESRLECLVDDLLVLARADEHTLALARGPIDLDDLVFEEAARLRATSNLRVDTSKVSAARIEGDSSSLRRALRNVADNAARHARTRVAFEVTTDAGMATVVVVDDGAGIPEEDRGRIFERFTRLETARDRDSGGSGLGLA